MLLRVGLTLIIIIRAISLRIYLKCKNVLTYYFLVNNFGNFTL